MGIFDWFKPHSGAIPVIKVGMSEQTVRKLLGKPKTKRGGSTILNELSANYRISGDIGQAASNEYAIYDHPAGTYQIVFSGGKVVEVHSQPGG